MHITLSKIIDIMHALIMTFHRLNILMIQRPLTLGVPDTIFPVKMYKHHLHVPAVFGTHPSPSNSNLMIFILKYQFNSLITEFRYK